MKPLEIQQKSYEDHDLLIQLLDLIIQKALKISNHIKNKTEVYSETDGFYIRFLNYQSVSAITVKQLILEGKYVDAFRIIRAIFENYLLYQLMIKGHIYTKKYLVPGQEKARYCQKQIANLEKEHAEGRAKDLLSIKPIQKNKMLLATYRGVKNSNPDDSETIPFYYFAFINYDSERHLVDKIPEIAAKDFYPEIVKKWQVYHENLHDEYLSFAGMKRGLILNEIYSDREFNKVSVHYHFLSMFTHPNKEIMRIIEGNVINSFFTEITDIQQYDRQLSELGLLYLSFLMKYFLDELIAYLPIHFEIEPNYLNQINLLFDNFRHFWFLKEQPHAFDKQQYLMKKNHAKMTQNRELDEEVPYYKNPLERLQKLRQFGFLKYQESNRNK